LGQLTLNVAIATALVINTAINNALPAKKHQCTKDRRHSQHDNKILLLLLAARFTPGEEVNSRHWSKLLRARPQPIIIAGASLPIALALPLLDRLISVNGFATEQAAPTFS